MRGARRQHRALGASVLLIGIALSAPRSAAADTDDDPTEINLNRVRKMMESRSTLAEACTWLANAYRNTRRGDMLLNLAECHRRQGKIASAWSEFDEAIRIGAQAKFPEAVAAATKLRDELATRVSRVTINLPPTVAALRDVVIELDGKQLPQGQWNAPATHDPGSVEVTARAKGYKPFTARVDVGAERSDQTIDVTLEAEPPSPPAPAPPSPAPLSPRPSPWPWFVGGLGVALGGVAVGFEISSKSAGRELNQHCGGSARNACAVGYDFDPARARELRGYDVFVGLGAASVVAIGAAATGLALRGSKRSGSATSIHFAPGAAFIRSSF